MVRISLFLRLVLTVVLALPAGIAAAGGVILVPPGNRSPAQPVISISAVVRTAETRGTFDDKYKRIYHQLAGNHRLIGKIKKIASLYGIDPIHMIGAIVGEHTYNVDVFDSLQTYYTEALAYLGARPRFEYKGEDIRTFVKRPQFAACDSATDDYDLWICRENVWRDKFKGRTVDGVAFPDDRMQRVFFQPFFAGQTFGIGQLSPLTALTVSDIVAARSGLPRLNLSQPGEIYHAVMDPDLSLHYMAAVISHDIDIYRDVAGFDISQNPGITATLYNIGDAVDHARALAAENRERQAKDLPVAYPRENYYGWLINTRLDELRKLL